LAVAVIAGALLAALPGVAPAWGPPETVAATRSLGDLQGAVLVRVSFDIDYVGLSWTSGDEPTIRFLEDGGWIQWHEAHEDDFPTVGGRTFSHLISASGSRVFEVSGAAQNVRAVAINTTDGPRTLQWQQPQAQASHLTQPPVISRPDWGADESYRFNTDGSEKWPPAFYSTQKLVIHHTATKNDDPDPAATVRAIYRYHAIDKGWGDIGYNFLVDEQGRIYKGRYSGPAATYYEDTLTGENSDGLGVTAAHVGGYNSGTMGIAVLGDYRGAKMLPAAARGAVVDHLTWESERHSLDPLATSTYVNPVNGATKTDMPNISGHLDWAATECPGSNFYDELPSIRQDVAAKLLSGDDTTEPGSSLHVHDLDGSGMSEPRGSWHAKVWVFVHDDQGSPVPNATVSYDWSFASAEPLCVTDGTGWCSVRSDSARKGSTKSITLTVIHISHSTLAYSGNNHDSDGDSNGTAITVNRPN